MEISAKNRLWDDIFHRYETENPLFDFKIECGKGFVSSLRSRVRCWFFTRNEIREVIVVLSKIAHFAAD